MNKANIYIQEVIHQIQYAKKCFASYRKARARDGIPNIFFYVHHFVVHVANVDKLLDPKLSNPRNKILRDSIDFTKVDLKGLRRLRNHLEHFDERLDDWIANYDGKPFFDNNLVDGTRGFPEKAFLRAMDGDIFKFYGESYDLPEFYKQLLEIDKLVNKGKHRKLGRKSRR
ncbi:MAG: hypothetical protein L0287_32430 [Anaerolineae bacterium]|nr:hypothetical protein [Anaerolineae bacterium]